MGRKPSASKNNDAVLSPENAHPSQERVEQQASSGNGNIKSTRVLGSQLENPQPTCSPLKHLNFPVDGVGTSLQRNTPQEKMNPEFKHKKKYATFSRKKSKYCSASVRRSERIKSGVVHPPNPNCGIEYIEDTTSGSEKDEPATRMEQVLQDPGLEPQLELEPVPEPDPEPEPEPAENLSGKSLGEKVDYALQRIDVLDKITELLTSKQVDGNVGLCESPSMASISYRSMYIDSQKKLEALTNENRQLAGKLENALGKIEMYEEMNRVLSEQLDANAAVLLNLAKTAEAAGIASTRAIHNTCSASASKRKRNES